MMLVILQKAALWVIQHHALLVGTLTKDCACASMLVVLKKRPLTIALMSLVRLHVLMGRSLTTSAASASEKHNKRNLAASENSHVRIMSTGSKSGACASSSSRPTTIKLMLINCLESLAGFQDGQMLDIQG